MSTQLDDLYNDHILDHFECPYHKGAIDHPSCSRTEKNPLCGDVVTLQLQINPEGKVENAYFDGKGCAISQAAASILCEHVEGKSVDELEKFQARDMLDLLKVPLTASRQKCGLLGFRLLKTLIYEQHPEENEHSVSPSDTLNTPVSNTDNE
ncbi:MAG: iron-sulfur cluster assembly scaffold protein [Planctomycetota bacterium]|nr:iron-sulfur cluster assembly scaffold protein [Planctomycetota bacterium]MDA1212352.1 iron-sulfur cluster assembly scaffold protein [Planctomycetota bacterium]